MNVEFSKQASLSIEGYRIALVKKYNCSVKRADELKQQMEDTIRAKASNADKLLVCQHIQLGQEKDAKGNCLNPNLRFLQYKTDTTKSTWGVSVICDFEHDVVTVHRIVHSSYLKEPATGWEQQPNASQQDKQKAKESSKWIPIQDFNKQIQEENTMKKLNITKEAFNKSRYFQNKYGKLEYVSESGKVYKTSKGQLIRFNESYDEDGQEEDAYYSWIADLRPKTREAITKLLQELGLESKVKIYACQWGYVELFFMGNKHIIRTSNDDLERCGVELIWQDRSLGDIMYGGNDFNTSGVKHTPEEFAEYFKTLSILCENLDAFYEIFQRIYNENPMPED